jgi:hypothetical protein
MHLRAKWSAFWRYRRRARRIGETGSGHPLFAVGPARVSLPPGSRQFFLVFSCSRCGRDIETQTSAPRAADLLGPDASVLCMDCARLPVGAAEAQRSSSARSPAAAQARQADVPVSEAYEEIGTGPADQQPEAQRDEVGQLLQERASGCRGLSDWM